jgi:superfamily II DNA or RNA helicase
VSDNRKRLLDEIRRTQEHVDALDHERAAAQKRLDELRRQLETNASPPATAAPGPGPTTPKAKLELFRSLFRGREDVFPRRWHNRKSGRAGYSPVCSNEWARGICDKPKVRCGDCPHQAFVALTDQAILDHLRGRHVIGVYPMLEDERCWFLAMDFDKGEWQQDVGSVVQVCEDLGVPVAVERSRSGAGAHLWFFFAAPVPAAVARKMGCYLLTRTMDRRHQLPMSSYDRLFPSQDTLPRGGFGNLIALPFQDEARRQGNSVFVDRGWRPHPSQWSYLAACRRMQPFEVHDLAQEASRTGQVVGVGIGAQGAQEELASWQQRASRGSARSIPSASLPEVVHSVLDERILVHKSGLSSELLSQIRRLAAFQNPEFYKRQALRLFTGLTPRVIACFEDTGEHVGLPRGCLDDLTRLLHEHGVRLETDDRRTSGDVLDVAFHGGLRPLQERAARALLAHETGVFVAPPGSGKTVVGAYLTASRQRTTLVLVHRTQLLEQWRTQLSVFLDRPAKEIGHIGGGRRRATGNLDVAMMQSLERRGEVDEILASYGHVIVDECHHVPAASFERVMKRVRARYVTGLTATPSRKDGHHPILRFQLGPTRFSVDPRSQAAERPFVHRLIVRETDFQLGEGTPDPGIQEIYRQLATSDARNRLILDDAIQALEEGRSPIVLTERRDHLDYLADQLRPVARNLVVLRGGMTARKRREVLERLASIPDAEERLLLATGRFIGEGFDDARLDSLMLAMPISWRGTLVQYAGRLHRMHQRKAEVRIYDYADRRVPMLDKMYHKRLKGYEAMGYAVLPNEPTHQPLTRSPSSSTTRTPSRRLTASRSDHAGHLRRARGVLDLAADPRLPGSVRAPGPHA